MPPDKKLRPTVFEPKEREKKPGKSVSNDSSVNPPPKVTRVSKATAIPGVERKKLSVTTTDLQLMSPRSDAQVYKKAVDLLEEVVVDRVTERNAILWGSGVQRSYGDLVNQSLTYSQDPVLAKVQRYLNRMLDILESIDILSVCGHGFGGAFASLAKPMNKKVDTPKELTESQAELALLIQNMNSALDQLLDLKDKLGKLSKQLDELTDDVEAHALAAEFLSKQPQLDFVARRYEERALSLTQTLAQIRQNDTIRKIQIEQPLNLVNAIQNVVLVMVPGLISSIASILMLQQSRTVSQTEASEVSDKLREIVNSLTT